MRHTATFATLAALVVLGPLPSRAEIGATGTRLSVGGSPARFYMTYGHMEEPEIYAPILQELKRLQVRFSIEGDTCTVFFKEGKVANWRVIRSRDDIPTSANVPFVLELGGSTYIPVKRLAQLVPIDLRWDKRNNLVDVTAGAGKPARVVIAPKSKPVTKPAAPKRPAAPVQKPSVAPIVAARPSTTPAAKAPAGKAPKNKAPKSKAPALLAIVRRGAPVPPDEAPVQLPEVETPAPEFTPAPVMPPIVRDSVPRPTRPARGGSPVVPPAVRPPVPRAVVTAPEMVPDPSATGSIELSEVDIEQSGGRLLVRVRASQPVRPTVLYLKAPTRIAFDFPDARWAPGIELPESISPIRSARVGHPAPGQARLVLDVTSPAVKVAGIDASGEEVRASLIGGQLTAKLTKASSKPQAKLLDVLRRRSAPASKSRVAAALGSRGGNPFRLGGEGDDSPDTPQLLPERNAWQYIIVHHSASPSGNAAAFDALHRRKGWDGLAYHFVINNGHGNPDGYLEVSPRWSSQKHGAHAGALPASTRAEFRNGFNEFGIGICLVGNFVHSTPTESQLQTLAQLIQELRAEFNIPAEHVLGHATVKGTACPGASFPWRKLFAMMELPAPQHLHRHPANLTTSRCNWCQERQAEK